MSERAIEAACEAYAEEMHNPDYWAALSKDEITSIRILTEYETGHAIKSAIRAYLAALAEDDAECERIGFEIDLHAHIIAEGGEDDGIANPVEVARAAIRALGE